MVKLWIFQFVIALVVFYFWGFSKVFKVSKELNPEKWMEYQDLSRITITLLGILEMVLAVGMTLPYSLSFFDIMPNYSPIAGLIFIVMMVAYIVWANIRHKTIYVVWPLGLIVIVAFVSVMQYGFSPAPVFVKPFFNF